MTITYTSIARLDPDDLDADDPMAVTEPTTIIEVEVHCLLDESVPIRMIWHCTEDFQGRINRWYDNHTHSTGATDSIYISMQELKIMQDQFAGMEIQLVCLDN